MKMLYFELTTFFIIGYLAIVFEKFLRVNKAAIALIMGALLWGIYFADRHGIELPPGIFDEQVSNTSQVIFFLLSAMVIVELIDSHKGFKFITDFIYTPSKKKLFWILIFLSFFMSAVLDNLTAMIVMLSFIRKLIPSKEERWLIGSVLVIAVNAGGAWTPIGDVTTTMLWIADKISTLEIMKSLFIPSIVNVVVAGILTSFFIKGKQEEPPPPPEPVEPGAKNVLFLGVLSLILVPVWKALLDIPPFMSALLGLGLLWLITDLIHFRHGKERWHLRVPHILSKVEIPSIMFFLGILLAVDALAISGLLKDFARVLGTWVTSDFYLAGILGLISSVIDNVPLVAATIGMYDPSQFPMDAKLWQLIAYAAGTGGSILIIGSAAGVAFMGIEKVDFLWFLKRITPIALAGYIAGLISYYFLWL